MAEPLFRPKVLRLLRDRGLITQKCIDLLRSWRHSGFAVHNHTTVDSSDTEGLAQALAKAASWRAIDVLARQPPRLRYHPDSRLILYAPKAGHELDEETRRDPLEFLLRWAALRKSPATSHTFEAARLRTIGEGAHPHLRAQQTLGPFL